MGSFKDFVPYALMVVIQIVYAGANILSKVAMDRGLSYFVFVVYRHIIATLILGPIAHLFERKQRPPLSFAIFMKIFIQALCGITIQQILYYDGLDYTSPTVACALANLIPALTFMMAVLLRMEKFDVRSLPGLAKVLGTMICIGGAMIFTFWKGFLLKGLNTKPSIILHHSIISSHGAKHGKYDWIKGSALIISSQLATSVWLILQAMIYDVYPAPLSMTTLLCFCATLQSSAAALVFERSLTSWTLDWNVQLFTIIYCGIGVSVVVYCLQLWCISKKGPVFSASFFPLLLIIVGIFSAFLFAERLHLGSVVGALLVIMGLHCVLWGKAKDNHFVKIEGRSDEEANTNNQTTASR